MGLFGLCSKKHSKKCNQKARLRRLEEESSVVLPHRPIPDTWWAKFRNLMFRQIENFENKEKCEPGNLFIHKCPTNCYVDIDDINTSMKNWEVGTDPDKKEYAEEIQARLKQGQLAYEIYAKNRRRQRQ
ncbi:uncharacterized protein LOC123293019 [Chrysoperla carnea]|uniref:uncharacterized protein LOC123293019 n=1 Tax=Chrysoperla carnea TaxID=189513 RepID=UPI001D08292E|nr:uncharacterized protein LOC123293019 [Chrysoperla carnea]